MSSGKVRALAVATDKIVPTMPDVPTLKEAGLPDFAYESWAWPDGAGRYARGVIIEKINKDVDRRSCRIRAMQDRMA